MQLEAEDQTPKTSEVKNDSESELHLKRLWFLRKKYIREIKRSEWIYKPINTFLGLSGHTIRK